MTKARAAILAAAGLLLGLGGWALGALPLSGAEPGGFYVDCGPAVFGRPSPLPDPTCSAAYAPLPAVSISLIAVAVALLVLAVAFQTRARSSPS